MRNYDIFFLIVIFSHPVYLHQVGSHGLPRVVAHTRVGFQHCLPVVQPQRQQTRHRLVDELAPVAQRLAKVADHVQHKITGKKSKI